MRDFFFSCDWGTSNFRLRLVNAESLHVVKEITSNDGVKKLHASCKTSDRFEHFVNFIEEKIDGSFKGEENYSLVISGMASSTIGMMELPYGEMPFNFNGQGLIVKDLKTNKGRQILLISGVKSETSVMRGEEIQAIGIAEYIDRNESGILILPGTHCKHLSYSDGSFYAMKTFITGELFQVISEHSILSTSMLKSNWNDSISTSFSKGLEHGFHGRMAENLFSIRFKDIIKSVPKEENYYFLSGLLIGDEISYLQNIKSKITLAASKAIFELYKTAFLSYLPKNTLRFINNEDLEMALIKGHKKIQFKYGN